MRLWTLSVGPRSTGSILYHGTSFSRAVRAGVDAGWPDGFRWYCNGRLVSERMHEQLTLLASDVGR